MPAAIELRDHCDGVTLRDLLKRSYGSEQTRRLLALAVVYRRWAAKLDAAQRQALADLVERGPILAVDRVLHWRGRGRAPMRYRRYAMASQ